MALLVKLAVVWLCATAGTAFGDSLVGVAFHDSESAYFAKAELFNEHSTIGPWKIVAPFPTNAFLKASSASGASEPYFAVEYVLKIFDHFLISNHFQTLWLIIFPFLLFAC